jgi:hypothetical protein
MRRKFIVEKAWDLGLDGFRCARCTATFCYFPFYVRLGPSEDRAEQARVATVPKSRVGMSPRKQSLLSLVLRAGSAPPGGCR